MKIYGRKKGTNFHVPFYNFFICLALKGCYNIEWQQSILLRF